MGPVGSIFVALAVIGTVLVVVSMLANPLLRRVSFRNVARRKGSTLLVIAGSMVGTALIAGSLIISDTARRLNQDVAYRQLGEIDEVVSLPGPQGSEKLYFDREQISGRASVDLLNQQTKVSTGSTLVDGSMAVIQEQVPVQKVGTETGESVLVEPRVTLVALDWNDLAGFGKRPPSVPAPRSGEVLVSPDLARELELAPADAVEVLTDIGAHRFKVAHVRDVEGMAGYWSFFLQVEGTPETMLMDIADGQTIFAGGADRANAIFVSNAGGVTGGYQHSGAVAVALGALLKDADPRGEFQVSPIKEDILDQPFPIGDTFLMFSMFVIVAGVMLVLNIYAMLAEERRKEMGVMRALGVRRDHLVRVYLYEGLLYSFGAALIGVLVGFGLARLVIWALNEFLSASAGGSVEMVFTVEPQSLLVAGAAGTVVTLGTVLYTSFRSSGINIVAAMKDMPEPPVVKRRRWTVVWPALLALIGIGLSAQAASANDGILYVVGPSFAALGIGLVVRRFLPTRAILSLTFVSLIAYSQLAFLIPAVEDANDSGASTFLTGMVLVLSAIGLLVLNFSLVVWLITHTLGRLRRILPVVRVAVAYPAERPTRTGFTLGMFSLVIFFAVVLSIFLTLYIEGAAGLQEGQVGGFDAIVRGNPTQPVGDLDRRLSAASSADLGGITEVSTLRTARVELTGYRQGDYESWGEPEAADPEAALSDTIAGVDVVFVDTTSSKLSQRSQQYGSDREVWEALTSDPTLAVIGDPYSGAHWRLERPVLEPGDTISLRDPVSGRVYEKTVAGRLASSIVEGMDSLLGIVVSASTLESEFSLPGGPPTGPYLLRIRDGVDQKAVANAVEKELVDTGAQVFLVSELIEEGMAWIDLLRILQAFLAFGLVVGIAGLAVVAARAVYQRRQDIGTLRALGFRQGMVLAYLLVESSFVSLLGLLLGVGAGTLAGYGAYLSFVEPDIGGPFRFPVLDVFGFVALVYLAGLVFTFLPAARAAALPPAEALRPQE